jgi:hypothetical protein
MSYPLLLVAIAAGGWSFFHFSVATLAGLVCPIFAQFGYLAGSLCMTLAAVLQHLLMLLVREGHIALGSGQVDYIGGNSGSGKSCYDKQGDYDLFHFFFSLWLVFLPWKAV